MAHSARSRARRAYGQNFLADPRAVRAVLDAAAIRPGDLVYEVGAGRGRLTTALLDRGARVVAFEVDPEMVAALPAHPALTVRPADFLLARPPRERFAVVGNIPYGLTAAVVDWCLAAPALVTATLLTQMEYARKRAGDYGRWTRLTIATWPVVSWELAGHIPRTAFRPVPRVDGGLLRLVRRPHPLIPPTLMPPYERMVDLGFTGLGGSLAASLARRYGRDRVAAAVRAARLAPDVPVGRVWPEQWLTVFRMLHAPRRRPGVSVVPRG
jgi:23S rRNA (adenine-N6)-dimethyltransferase